MLTRFRGFLGTAPRVTPRLLPPNAAQRADDCKLWQGEIRPWGGLRQSEIPFHGLNTVRIYRYEDGTALFWFNWDKDVDVVQGAVGDDTLNRIFYTGDGEPKKTGNDIALVSPQYPAASYKMGVKAPATAPVLTKTVAGSGTLEDRSYVFTFVTGTGWSEEGAPSLPKEITGVEQTGSTVEVDMSGESNPDTAYNIVKARIYRTLTGTTATDFVFVGEITWDFVTAANNKFNDTLDADALGAALITYDFEEPPSDLTAIVALSNGVNAGFSGKFIYFSEPFFPYAWPSKYRKAVKDQPIALGAVGNLLVVATNEKPHLFQGIHPAQMSGGTLKARQSCKSKRSLKETPFGVVWGSPDGLILVAPGGQVKIVTRPLLSRDEWQALSPETMIAEVHDGRYYCSYLPIGSATRRLFVFDPNEPSSAFTFINQDVQALYSDGRTDALYMLIGGTINQWDADSQNPIEFVYTTKREAQAAEVNKSYAQIKGGFTLAGIIGGNLTFDEYNTLRTAIIAANAALYAFPSAYLPQSFGTFSFGEHAFGGDDTLGGLPDIGQGVAFRLFADDDVLRHTVVVKDELPFALPGGYLAQEYAAEVQGRIKVEEILLADEFEDLKQG